MKLPQAFLDRINQQWPNEAGDLLDALQAPASISLRINAKKAGRLTPGLEKVPWAENAYYLPERPLFTLDPWWHAGAYYVQEASSMLLEAALKQLFPDNQPLTALDLCGAPGGKSTHLASLLPSGSALVSNEVIRARSKILAENLQKWGRGIQIVTQNDPRDFQALKHQFDLMVVDAPCSGEGMFRKDEGAIGEWSETHLELCTNRQRRILMDVWDALKPGGILLYSTCTFNPAENEENLAWLGEQEEVEAISLDFPAEWGIVKRAYQGIEGNYCLPHRVKGEGFFLAAIRRLGEPDSVSPKKKKRKGKAPELPWKPLSKQLVSTLPQWISPEVAGRYIQLKETLIWLPDPLIGLLERMENHFRVVSAGVSVGEWKKKDIRPEAALGLYVDRNQEAFSQEELDLKAALSYLSRQQIDTHMPAGWGVVTFGELDLGFVKNIQNRTNTYWPAEWKIRMRIPNDLSKTFLLKNSC